jgi:hypothetical protein
MHLEFGPNFGYLAAAYAVLLVLLGGYAASLFARARDIEGRGHGHE